MSNLLTVLSEVGFGKPLLIEEAFITLTSALDPAESLIVLFRQQEEGYLTRGPATGDVWPPIPRGSELARRLDGLRSPAAGPELLLGLTGISETVAQAFCASTVLPIRGKYRVYGALLVPRAAEAAGTGSTLHAQARIVALALDHCELKRLADDDRIAAKEIQERLLRSSFPTVQGLDIAHRYRSALAASGDFYCLSRPDASSLIVAVGDVAGKGIAAALMAAHINAELQYMNARASDNIGAHIASLNRVVCQASLPGSYLSLFYGLINLDRCTMRYVNAGHQPLPLHIRRRSGAVPFALDAGGPPVGLFRIPPEPYEVGEVVFQSGDVLLVATDGVTDAENPAGDAWGTDAFTRTAQILAGSGCIAEKVVGQIVEAIDLHCAGEPQGDDITVVCIKFE